MQKPLFEIFYSILNQKRLIVFPENTWLNVRSAIVSKEKNIMHKNMVDNNVFMIKNPTLYFYLKIN